MVATPLAHDSAAEISQPDMKQWIRGEGEAIPGKTMPDFKIVKRDYKNVYKQFMSWGPLVRKNGLGAHGTQLFHCERIRRVPQDASHRDLGRQHLSVARSRRLMCATRSCISPPVTNGELAYRSYQRHGREDGRAAGASGGKESRLSHFVQGYPEPAAAVHQQPDVVGSDRKRPVLFAVHLQRGGDVPWRTLTGRQSFYLDHPVYIDFGEHLPTYKPKPLPTQYADLQFSEHGAAVGPTIMLNYPHAARQVAYPLDLWRQPADDDSVARHLSAVDERPGRGVAGHQRQRLGGSVQR